MGISRGFLAGVKPQAFHPEQRTPCFLVLSELLLQGEKEKGNCWHYLQLERFFSRKS